MKKSEGIIRPGRRKHDPEIGPDAIMVMIPSDLDRLIKCNTGKKMASFDMTFFTLYLVEERGSLLCFSGPFLGAPQAVMGLEKLIALGAERIWVTGWCGSLIPGVQIGDFIIPTWTISEEGTSRHYPIENGDIQTDDLLNQMLEERLLEMDQAFRKGPVWTTDAPYRETPEKIQKFGDMGILAVDMELSALITVSIFRKARLAGLLVVSDELFHLKWKPGFGSPSLEKSTRLAADLLMELILSTS